MCKLFKAEPVDNLYLSTWGERGVCLKKPVNRGDVVLSIPISSCFRDDEPPSWYGSNNDNIINNSDEEHDITDYERYNPSAWASRLAASLLDMELINNDPNDDDDNNQETTTISNDNNDDLKLGREIWHSMLPNKDRLRASLPVHWGEEVLSTSKCTALELAVDSAYFARATAVMALSEELQMALDCTEDEMLHRKCVADALDIALDMEMLQQKCHDALDIVQTRACRVERKCEDGIQWGPPLRILAPIFDFINHGSGRRTYNGGEEGSANAAFTIENERMCDMHDAKLVVRAMRDIAEGEEVLIDYGNSARPAWRCLTSYGFVPEYDVELGVNGEEREEEEEAQNAENVAELWMNGLRFEVDPHSVPYDLVEVAATQALFDRQDDDDKFGDNVEDPLLVGSGGGMFTPVVARAIAKRATEAAFHLITEPEITDEEEDWDDPEFVHSASLAALLRWSQHKVLLAFADNLKLFASSHLSGEEAE